MRSKEFDKAIETLKSYENKEPHLVAHAATNLSFIYYHEGERARPEPTPSSSPLPLHIHIHAYSPPLSSLFQASTSRRSSTPTRR